MKKHNGTIKKAKILALTVFFLVLLISFLTVVSAESFKSTSIYSTQYFPPSSVNSFSSLMSGPTEATSRTATEEELFDLQLFIPPLGCQPYVVRSDLLEEQDVPVFCQLIPLKINPGIDITRINSISVVKKENNPYIGSVGFHPARAAIKARTGTNGVPSGENLGYVVVVLKRQEAEKYMPENVSIVLAARLDYGTENSFGIGKNEFYVPELSDADFANDYQEYSFYDGIGYLRAEGITQNSAKILVYSSDSRIIFSDTIEKGKTSRDFYLSNSRGGQGIRITLKDLTLPQTQARIMVNGQKFDVYAGQEFAEGCILRNINNFGLGAGTAEVFCNGNKISLERKIKTINLEIGSSGRAAPMAMYQKVNENDKSEFYLISVGKLKISGESYVVLANISKDNPKLQNKLDDSLKRVGANFGREASSLNSLADVQRLAQKEISVNGVSFPVIVIGENSKNDESGVRFKGFKSGNANIFSALDYFQKAINSYEDAQGKFGVEIYPETKYTYAEKALWAEYDLASALGQSEKENEVLSRILNEYPNSVHPSRKQTAAVLINSQGLLANNEEARFYDSKSDLSFELVSIKEPSAGDASVGLSYSIDGKLESLSSVASGTTFYTGETKSLTLESFGEDSARIKCSYNLGSGEGKSGTISGAAKQGERVNFGKESCDASIYIERINLKRVAQVQIIPITRGKSRESNFTFNIGIEKRSLGLNLTPEEANAKIAKLTEQIDKLKNITEGLGKLIEGGKLACLATSTIYNLKNLLANKNGDATARSEVMKRWNDICSSSKFLSEGGYKNSEDCIAGEYDKNIKPEIDATAAAMKKYNERYNELKNKNKIGAKGDRINDNAVKAELISDIEKMIPDDFKLLDANGNEVDCKELYDVKSCADFAKGLINSGSLGNMTYYETSRLYFDIQMAAPDSQLSASSRENYQQKVYDTLRTAKERADAEGGLKSLSQRYPYALALGAKETQEAKGYFQTWSQVKGGIANPQEVGNINGNTKVAIYTFAPLGNYLAILEPSAKNTYTVSKLYLLKRATTTDGKDTIAEAKVSGADVSDAPAANLRFIEEDPSAYQNPCSNCNYMKVFALEPHKGMPALLPFDFENGFYVQVKNDFPGLGTGNVASYQDSGRVNTFYLCNVGKNKLMEGYQVNDDSCRRFDFYTGDMIDSYPSLTKQQTQAKVQEALRWLSEAQKQLANNPSATTIKINGRPLTVKNAEGDAGSKCTDFMSPSDCQVIYNVCDPFVCPNSRCDFGGRYPVDNVIQSGVVGSTLLCLPNWIVFHPKTGVILPVCVTGINAGLSGWISILQDYRSCINESVTTGKMIGICDAIYSVYLCDFFWRQAGPLASALVKNLFLAIFGTDDKGGGEYLFVNDAWNNAENSAKFFQTNYAKDSKLTFGFQNLASNVVAEVCKSQASATYPDNFKTMLEPEIPVQFTANFEELPYTSATVPPTSQYNVFYHIYGGDAGHSFQVYLKSPQTSVGYIGRESVVVASGYISKGQSASETKNFIDTSGYKELCVRIDMQDKCGFKTVSTSAALNYAKDKAVASQATSEITSENECIAGGHSIGSFLTPNLQQGVEEFVNPEVYNQGLIRVCSNKNPGEGVNPSRWSDVGYCDERSTRCWLDEKSVQKAIRNKGIENETLSEIEKISIQNLIEEGGYFDATTGSQQIGNLEIVYNWIAEQIKKPDDIGAVSYSGSASALDYASAPYNGRRIANLDLDISELDKKLTDSANRARLWYFKALVYDKIAQKEAFRAKILTAEEIAAKKKVDEDAAAAVAGRMSIGTEGGTSQDNPVERTYSVNAAESPPKLLIKEGTIIILEIEIRGSILQTKIGNNFVKVGSLNTAHRITILPEFLLKENNIPPNTIDLLNTLSNAQVSGSEVKLEL